MARSLITTPRTLVTHTAINPGTSYGTPTGLLLALTRQVTSGGQARGNATGRIIIT